MFRKLFERRNGTLTEATSVGKVALSDEEMIAAIPPEDPRGDAIRLTLAIARRKSRMVPAGSSVKVPIPQIIWGIGLTDLRTRMAMLGGDSNPLPIAVSKNRIGQEVVEFQCV